MVTGATGRDSWRSRRSRPSPAISAPFESTRITLPTGSRWMPNWSRRSGTSTWPGSRCRRLRPPAPSAGCRRADGAVGTGDPAREMVGGQEAAVGHRRQLQERRVVRDVELERVGVGRVSTTRDGDGEALAGQDAGGRGDDRDRGWPRPRALAPRATTTAAEARRARSRFGFTARSGGLRQALGHEGQVADVDDAVAVDVAGGAESRIAR